MDRLRGLVRLVQKRQGARPEASCCGAGAPAGSAEPVSAGAAGCCVPAREADASHGGVDRAGFDGGCCGPDVAACC